jgi:hypothetical protein
VVHKNAKSAEVRSLNLVIVPRRGIFRPTGAVPVSHSFMNMGERLQILSREQNLLLALDTNEKAELSFGLFLGAQDLVTSY